MFDIIFLSYDEVHSDILWDSFSLKFPWAKRVHGVKGLYNAHKAAALAASTKMFWVVDCDTSIINFNFSFVPANAYDENIVHVWYSHNPVNGLEYGYGGIKLFPRKRLLETTEAGIDVTTSVFKEVIVVPEVVSITYFNSSPLNTWRSAFRENVKLYLNLTNGNEVENSYRMDGWLLCNSEVQYANLSVAGAKAGQEYADRNKDNAKALALINDYNWLKNKFEEYYGHS